MTKEEYEKLRNIATPRLPGHTTPRPQLTEGLYEPNQCDDDCGRLVPGGPRDSEIPAMVSGNPYARIEDEDPSPAAKEKPREFTEGANSTQVGGAHYQDTHLKCPNCGHAMQHWDVSWLLGWDMFMYCITKYLWRWQLKGGLNDVRKARHYLDKYIEVLEKEQTP